MFRSDSGLTLNGRTFDYKTFFDRTIQGRPRTLFVKLDDDIVWTAHGLVARLAAHKLLHPDPEFRRMGMVSANTVNHGHLANIHAQLGAWNATPPCQPPRNQHAPATTTR